LFGCRRAAVLTALVCAVCLGFAAGPALAKSRSESGSDDYVTFVARQCTAYTDIYANRARNNIVESLKDLGLDTLYQDGQMISPGMEEIAPQTNCTSLPGWQFTLGTGYVSRAVSGPWGSLSIVTDPFPEQGYPGVSTIQTLPSTTEYNEYHEPVGTIAGAVTIQLTKQQAEQASSPDQLWAQGGTPTDPMLADKFFITGPGDPQYAFGTLRCAVDNLNGDNVEYIFFPAGVNHVFCYGYYVKPPPTSGTITIAKKVVGAPDAVTPAFPFNGTISFDPNGFQLSNGGSIDFYRAGGAAWTVTEGSVANYTLESLVCSSADGTSTYEASGSTVTINLAAADHMTCTYTNRYTPPPGGLTISKVTRGGVGTFSYEVTPVSGGASRSATATTTVPNVAVNAVPSLQDLPPNTYRIVEDRPVTAGGRWRLQDVNCNGQLRSATAPVTVTVRSGAQVTCVFTNAFSPRGSISLAKITKGATGTASFLVQPVSGKPAQYLQTATTTSEGVAADATPNTPADRTKRLRLGTYRITEQPPLSTPAGDWTLTQVECNGVLVPFAQGSIQVMLSTSQPSLRCVYTDVFSTTPAPEPGPEPPEPLPPNPIVPPAPNPDEPSATWTDLGITKTASPTVVTAGGVITYRITVTNHGPNDATSVVVGDKLSGSATLVSVHSDVGHCQAGPPAICHLGTLKPGKKVTITLQVRVSQQTGRLTNRVVVGTATYDPDLANNLSRATVRLVPAPAVTG
jgi:uncharacterized repeat protein (TIGR01451 family)